MEAVVDLHLSAAVSEYKHNVFLIHQLPFKPVRYVRTWDLSSGTRCPDVGSAWRSWFQNIITV